MFTVIFLEYNFSFLSDPFVRKGQRGSRLYNGGLQHKGDTECARVLE